MASVISSLPGQQQQGGTAEIEQPNQSSYNVGAHSSGSIGPFSAVISVLAILGILSCILGRMCTRKDVSPLDSIQNRGCLGLLKRARRWSWRGCKGGDVEAGGAKVMALGHEEKQDGKISNDENPQHPAQP